MAEDRPVDELITWDLRDGVGTITINRADKKNSLTFDMRDRIRELVEGASEDLRIRVLVLTGSGSSFCAGADVAGGSHRERPPRPEGAPERATGDVARMIQRGWQQLIAAVQDCEKPVIAAVNGVAAGGGMNLALACDLVVAAEGARLVSAFIRRGIMPDAGGAWMLSRLVGPQQAKRILFLGDDIPADEAQRLGLVLQVVPADQLDKAVAELAGRLAVAPTKAIGSTKLLVNRAAESDRDTSFLEEAWLQEVIQSTDDAREGIASFRERRPPEFKGW